MDTNVTRMYVMLVEGGIDPELFGPFDDEEEVLLEALRRHALSDAECDAVFVLVQHDGALTVQTYGTGITTRLAGDSWEEGPYCRFCQKLAGPDWHCVEPIEPGTSNVVCPACFDERLR